MSLPIEAHLSEILDLWKSHRNLVLTAPPGSGKTLRVPPLLLQALRSQKNTQKIVVLVPKRIAALSASNKIAIDHAWTIGDEHVGYQVRFDHRLTDKTQLIFMTEGVFVKRLADEAFIRSIDTVIFDEFHERSSNNDLALGFCLEQQILDLPLKILVMSATLNTSSLLSYLPDAGQIHIEAKPFPLKIEHHLKAQRLQCSAAFFDELAELCKKAFSQSRKDLLVFLPGLHEIRLAQNKLKSFWPIEQIKILHGSINLDEQQKIIQPASDRRIILSTNIAESSLTLPSVDAVIDSGLEKKSTQEQKIGFHRLELKRITLFSAKQRAGRAARTGPGICYQMWHESDERSMNAEIEPEILKSNLLQETLTLSSIGITEPDHFSWLTQPERSFQNTQQQLKRWHLIDQKNQITSLGHLVQKCPLDIERGTLFVELCRAGFAAEASHFIAFLETHDFSKSNVGFDLNHLELTHAGQQIKHQLLKLQIHSHIARPVGSFKTELFKIFLKFFPEKMAQKKSDNTGISSLGRGVQFLNHLVHPKNIYYLLFSGREISDSTTQIDFAVGYSPEEFLALSQSEQKTVTQYQIDFDKNKIYKLEKKMSGYFTTSPEVKSEVTQNENATEFKKIFQQILQQQMSIFLNHHPHWEKFQNKFNFLIKKEGQLDLSLNLKLIQDGLPNQIFEILQTSVSNPQEFFNLNLYDNILFLLPDELKNIFLQLPDELELPYKKRAAIDYKSELAPLVSVRLQELFGLQSNPSLVGNKFKITFELLAPNYRPTQITSQIEKFWQTSYHDVRKDLRARYPKHDWPENPLDWSPEMSKRFKK